MSVTFPVTGATYRLKAEVQRKIRITLDMRHHEDGAKLVEYVQCWGAAILDRELAGSKVWPMQQLAWVRGAKEPRKREEVPLQFRKSLLPAQRRDLIHGEVHSNLDFGFTPAQAKALDELEAAIKDNEHPCIGGDRRRQCRARVTAVFHEVLKLKLLDALTPREREVCRELFLGNTVL